MSDRPLIRFESISKTYPNGTVALSGFSDAFDGPPLKQSDIEDRQKKLQDFVAKNNQDFAKKLKEEQDKAKSGN